MLNQIRFWYKDEYVTAFICDRYPGYSLTEDGRVFSHRKGLPIAKGIRATTINYKEGKPRKIQKNPKGYPIVGLCFWGKQHTAVLHNWMAFLFYGPKPEGLEVRHLDGDNSNYHYKNLKYGTGSENHADRVLHGTSFSGGTHPNSKLTDVQATEIRKLRLNGVKVKKLMEIFNVGECTITDILQDKSYKCGTKILLRKSENYTKRFKNHGH